GGLSWAGKRPWSSKRPKPKGSGPPSQKARPAAPPAATAAEPGRAASPKTRPAYPSHPRPGRNPPAPLGRLVEEDRASRRSSRHSDRAEEIRAVERPSQV